MYNNDDLNKLDSEFIFDEEDFVTKTNPPAETHIPRRAKAPSPSFRTKFMSVLVITVLGCSSLGIGLGMGSGLYNSFFNNNKTPAAAETFFSALPESEIQSDMPEINFESLVVSASDSDVVSVIKQVSNSVVSINVETTVTDYFNRAYSVASAGSGIIFSEDNDYIYVVTNQHVVANARSVEISIDDTNSVAASAVGNDAQSDIAVIRVAKTDLVAAGITDYTIATFGDAQSMEIGESVIAIGNALGQGKSATLGIISAKNKQIDAQNSTYIDVIQTDAAINQGNSGGALVNMRGQVIGINTVKVQGTGVEGMGYAIPSNTVKEVVDMIMEQGIVERPYIGITGATITDRIKDTYSLTAYGVLITQVTTGSGAETAGLAGGDVITAYNGSSVTTFEQLQEYISASAVGDSVQLTVVRGNETMTVAVTLKDANLNNF